MENAIKYEAKQTELSAEDIKTLTEANIIPKGTPPAQIQLFSRVCYEKGLSPFSKQIHLIPRKSKDGITRYTHQTAIDGFRSIAERTGVYAGNDDYKFNGDRTEFELIKEGSKQPITATATVYKIVGGIRCPFSATARWEEYYPGDTLSFMWKKMPFLMLGKCAEALALRKAFPESLGGLYTNDEMMQADVKEVEIIETKAVEVKDTVKAKPKPKKTNDGIIEAIESASSKMELKTVWMGLTEEQRETFKDKFTEKKNSL